MESVSIKSVDGASFHARTYIIYIYMNMYNKSSQICFLVCWKINFPVAKMAKISIKTKLLFQSCSAIKIYTNYFERKFFHFLIFLPQIQKEEPYCGFQYNYSYCCNKRISKPAINGCSHRVVFCENGCSTKMHSAI